MKVKRNIFIFIIIDIFKTKKILIKNDKTHKIRKKKLEYETNINK
jgi:hypothetical protein